MTKVDLLTIEQVVDALPVRKTARWVKEFLRKTPCDPRGEPYFRRAGRTKLFTRDDVTRIAIAVTGKSVWDLLNDQLAGIGPEPPKQQREGHVYFIEAGDFIKIGYTTSPVARVIKMRTDCPWPIRILHHEPGTFKDEKVLHRRFEAIRANGEWFRRDAVLLEYIEGRKVAK